MTGKQGTGTSADREAMKLARASYERCCAGGDFFSAFYRNFFALCPEAEPRFEHTDFSRQNALLRHALGLLLSFPAQPEGEPSILARVAERHSRRDLDIPPSLYGPFIDSLIHTVKEHDTEFTAETERSWRTTLASGVAYMQSRY